ncbi:MAG: NAD(P)-dependent glyceraldehyde 3-phosphate dehydrogenase archaeal [Methanothrix sp.]|nr:MAG: NAD(P)-dependent glyceraldehyde 3-phosphate dehydrogenase archaeal [Methanothrix sp.]
MRSDAGFVGFDGTENKRTILAIDAVKKAGGIEGDLNVLLRKPHGRAKSVLSKLVRLCDVQAYVSDAADQGKWESAGFSIRGGYQDFFEDSDFIMVGTPGDQEAPYVEAGLAHGSTVSLMGGAHRDKIRAALEEKGFEITDDLEADFSREFFFGLENYELFTKARPKVIQCTSCNTTGICRASLAARPLGLKMILGNIDRRQGDPHTVVRASPSAASIGKGVGHQGTDAGTIFEEVEYSIRASKIPTTVPHTSFLEFVFEGDVAPEEFLESLASTREVVVFPYADEGGRKHEWTSEILEAFLTGFERPISPEIFELLFSDAIIPVKLGDYTILQGVMMVEQMSIAVPNHVESYLLNAGYSAEKVHSTVDEALSCVHGVWPDRLST